MAHTWQVCRHFITSSQQSFIYCEKTFLRFWRKWYSRLLRNGAKTEDRNQEEAFWRRVVGVVDVVGAHNQKKLNCFVRIFSLSRSTSMLPLLLSFLSASIPSLCSYPRIFLCLPQSFSSMSIVLSVWAVLRLAVLRLLLRRQRRRRRSYSRNSCSVAGRQNLAEKISSTQNFLSIFIWYTCA